MQPPPGQDIAAQCTVQCGYGSKPTACEAAGRGDSVGLQVWGAPVPDSQAAPAGLFMQRDVAGPSQADQLHTAVAEAGPGPEGHDQFGGIPPEVAYPVLGQSGDVGGWCCGDCIAGCCATPASEPADCCMALFDPFGVWHALFSCLSGCCECCSSLAA